MTMFDQQMQNLNLKAVHTTSYSTYHTSTQFMHVLICTERSVQYQ